MGGHGQHTLLHLNHLRVVLDNHRLNRVQTDEGTLFELEQRCTVGRAAFCVNDKRRVELFLGLLLALRNQ